MVEVTTNGKYEKPETITYTPETITYTPDPSQAADDNDSWPGYFVDFSVKDKVKYNEMRFVFNEVSWDQPAWKFEVGSISLNTPKKCK